MTPVEEIKQRLDIVETISNYINLQQAGGNFKARCPFHNEKTASFMVSKEKQIWHCFGCDKGGDVISFVQEYEGVDFREAIRLLAEKANVSLAGFAMKPKENNTHLYEINEQAAQFFANLLDQDSQVSKKVNEYLERRKINKGSIDSWRLGLSGDSWDGLLRYLTSRGFKEQDIFQAGLILRKKDGSGYVDRFRKRLMFPICDTQGRVVAFTSRTLSGIAYDEEEQGGKYVNSPQTSIYDKSRTLYGWHLGKDDIRKKKYLIVVEGNMDVIASHQTAAKNTVAVSGTALTIDQIKLIKRYTENVILAFDGDAAGSRASFRSISLCWQEDMNVKVIILPKDKDPADMIKDDPDSWLKSIKESIPVMDYYFKRVVAGVDLNRADHKKIAVNKLLPIIKYLKSDIEQIHYLKLLSEKFQIPLEILQKDLGETQSFLEKKEVSINKQQQDKKDHLLLLSEQMLSIACFKANYLEELIENIEPDMMATECQSLYKQLIIYYTKHHNLDNFIDYPELSKEDKDIWVRLSLSGAKNYENISDKDLANDFQASVYRLKQSYLDKERQELIAHLRQAEFDGDQEEQEKITSKINIINKEIHKLQS